MGTTVPYLVERSSGKEHELPENRTLKVGASAKCDICVDPADAAVSAIHGLLKYTGGKVIVAVRHESTKVFVNDVAIQKKVLDDGDVIRIGSHELQLELRELVDPLIGSELAGYDIEEFLGKGGMGTVYKATQLSLNRPVALKVLAPEFAADRELVERFFKEAQAMARLNNPNVVQVYDALEATHDDVEYVFFSMEHMPGGDLGDLIRREGPLPLENAFAAVHDASCALTWAEEHGIVHRDIKPDNLLIAASGTTKVADLGIAIDRLVTQEDRQKKKKKKWVGSPRFMAPEQALAKGVDHRSDIYALGCTLVYALTGEYLFSGRSHVEILKAKVNQDPPSILEFLPGLSHDITEVVDTMVARNPDDRYASCLDMQNALHGALTSIVQGDTAAEPGADDDYDDAAEGRAAAAVPGAVGPRSPRQPRPALNTTALVLWGVAAVCVVFAALAVMKLANLDDKPSSSGQPTEVARNGTNPEPPVEPRRSSGRREPDRPRTGQPRTGPRTPKRPTATSRTATRLREIFDDYRAGSYTATQAIGELERLKRRASPTEVVKIDQAIGTVRRDIAKASEQDVTKDVNERVMPLLEKKRFREAYAMLESIGRRYSGNEEMIDQTRQLIDDEVETAWKGVASTADRLVGEAKFAAARTAVGEFAPELNQELRAQADAKLAAITELESSYLEARAAMAGLEATVGAAIASLDFAKAAELADGAGDAAKTTPGGDALALVRSRLREQPKLCEAVWNRLSAGANDAIRRRLPVAVVYSDRPTGSSPTYVFEKLEGSHLLADGPGRSKPRVALLGLADEVLFGFLGGAAGVDAADLEGLGLLLLHSGRAFRSRALLLDERISEEKIAHYEQAVDLAEDRVLSAIMDQTEKGVAALEAKRTVKSYAADCARFSDRVAGWIVTLRDSSKYKVARGTLTKAFLTVRPEALRGDVPQNLFRGKVASYRRSQIKLQYKFENPDEKLDFHAVQKGSVLRAAEKSLTFGGEYRLGRGNPFQENLVVMGSAVKYLRDAPNINIALWTQEKDTVTPIPDSFSVGTTTGGTTGGTTGTGGTPTPAPTIVEIPDDYLVFGIGFKSRHYCSRAYGYDALEMDGVPGGAVPMPAYVLLGGIRGKPIHTVPVEEGLCGAGAVGKFKGKPIHFQLLASPKKIEFAVNGTSRITRKRVSNIVERFGGYHGVGSITIFTNGRHVTLSSLTIEAELNPRWIDQRLLEMAATELIVLEDLPPVKEPPATPDEPKSLFQ